MFSSAVNKSYGCFSSRGNFFFKLRISSALCATVLQHKFTWWVKCTCLLFKGLLTAMEALSQHCARSSDRSHKPILWNALETALQISCGCQDTICAVLQQLKEICSASKTRFVKKNEQPLEEKLSLHCNHKEPGSVLEVSCFRMGFHVHNGACKPEKSKKFVHWSIC